MPALSLILNAHSIENVPVIEWHRPILELYNLVASIQPSFKNISVSHEFKVQLESDPTLQGIPRQFKSLLRNLFVSPYLKPEDENRMAEPYIENEVYLETISVPSEPGKVAWLYQFPMLSFAKGPWINPTVSICIKESTGRNYPESLKNIAVEDHARKDHFYWLQTINPAPLPLSNQQPEKKRVYLQDHHGKDILKPWAKKFRNCPYIEEIESAAWKSQFTRFVRDTYPFNGHWYAHCILYQTDKGYSLLFRLSAKSQYDADRIALELEKLYP